MRKNIFVILAALLMICSMTVSVFAATPTVTFDGTSDKFVYNTSSSDFGAAFKDMIPGETRTMTFTIKNTSEKPMQFYFTAEGTKDFTQAAGAAYMINFSRNGVSFYDGTLGGKDSNGNYGSLTNLEVGNSGTDASGLTDRLLVASLASGESQDINMTMELDGTSTGNEYQGKEASVHFTFFAAYDDFKSTRTVTTKKTVKEPDKTVQGASKTVSGGTTTVTKTATKTGDDANALFPLIILFVSGTVIVLLIIFRKRKLQSMLAIALLLLVTFSSQVQAASQYTVTYKSGNHGTINGDTTYDVVYNNGEAFSIPSDSIVVPASGYYFVGWNDAQYHFPSQVTRRLTYVAKYKKIVNAVEYSILYVDTDGVEIATRTTDVTDASVVRSVTPPTITGYTVTSGEAQLQNAANPIITFTYNRDITTITNVETITIPGTTTVIPGTTTVLPGTTTTVTTGTTGTGTTAGTAGTTTSNAAGTGTTAGTTGTTAGTTEGTTITEPQVPLGDDTANETADAATTEGTGETTNDQTVTLTDGQTPLAESPESSGGWFLPAAIGVGSGAILIAGIWFILSKKRNSL